MLEQEYYQMTDHNALSKKTDTGTSSAGVEGRRQPYIAPKILSREKLESIAGICTKSTVLDSACDPATSGIINS